MSEPRKYCSVESASCDAVIAASHPSPEAGGPCATCAFRPGTEANLTETTITLARLCVEGMRPFQCHETPQLCRGYIAAANLQGVPEGDEAVKWAAVCGIAADLFAEMIEQAKAAQGAP